ncbi:MAG: D-alanyl-D-alanine carboxypeptidase family protein [Patescibacteria group bacterium]
MKFKTILSSVRSSWIFRQWDRILLLFVIAAFFIILPSQGVVFFTNESIKNPFRQVPFAVPAPRPYPVSRTNIYPQGEVSATGVVIFDPESGATLFARNADESLSPASTTKILTALVALDAYNLDDVVTIQTVANSGQVMGLLPGEQITVENLLYGALIHSGNDAAWALAEHYTGGVDAFVTAMNTKAQSLHLTSSHFTNPVGYDNPDHKMTATDLARLSAFALTNHTIAKIVAIPQITISDVAHTRFHALTNVNQLLGKIPGVGGIKTGWTEEAGENLVTLVTRNGHSVIIVVLKSADRFKDTAYLIDWVFSNFDWKTFTPPIQD